MTDVAPTRELPLTTALELPHARVRDHLGVVFGLVVRSMGIANGFKAGLTTLRQGEVPQYTQLLEDSRRQALDRMIANARLIGADAVIAVRFDSTEVGQSMTEILAYGTAVTLGDAG